MRRTLLAALVFILSPGVLQAQVNVGGQLSLAEDTDFGIGARTTIGLSVPSFPLEVIASFDYFFPEDRPAGNDVTYWELNGSVAHGFPVSSRVVKPYVGAGLSLAHTSIDNIPFVGTASNIDVALNILGGAKFTVGNVNPFGELRIELGGAEQFVLTGGVMFQVGPRLAPKR